MSGTTAPDADRGHDVDVTVVTVTYQAAGFVAECLDSLRAQRLGDLRMRVVVVDNASTDGTADLVAAGYPEVELVRSARNTGFAGGNNVVLRTVASPVVVLLNSDAVAEPDLVAQLVAGMRAADARVAALSATVLLQGRYRAARGEDDPARVVTGPDGAWVPDPRGDVTLVNSTGNVIRVDGFGVDRGWLADAAHHRPPRGVFGFCGAAAALRTAALRDAGVFDDDFFLYYEDSDLSWRLRLAGWTVEHCPGAVAHHRHAASSGEGSAVHQFHDHRNRLLMLLKCATAGRALRAWGRYLLTTLSITLRRRQPAARVLIRWRALRSALRLAPVMVRRRREIGGAARTPRHEVERLLAPVAGAPGPLRPAGS